MQSLKNDVLEMCNIIMEQQGWGEASLNARKHAVTVISKYAWNMYVMWNDSLIMLLQIFNANAQ